MRIKDIVYRVFMDCTSEYFSMSPIGFTPAPALYNPARAAARQELEGRLGSVWDDGYRDFLSITDGMSGLQLVFLGVKDWSPGDWLKLLWGS
ncbi:hypothetical protein [Streptomyces roseoviridis]|uniref:Uncharacterized protein n=1 Tax=Streptomyces roseoviridis TaxID=67361 RepID=A0ABV5QS94_9ACTN